MNTSAAKLPDYSAGVSISSGDAVPNNGVIAGLFATSSNRLATLSINNVVVSQENVGANYQTGNMPTGCFIVSKGDIITYTNANSVMFYPFKS